MRDVDADPSAIQLLRGRDGGSAAAERVQHDVAFVAARADDPLKQRFRLLRRIAEAFLRRELMGGMSVHTNADGTPLQLIEIALVAAALVPRLGQ